MARELLVWAARVGGKAWSEEELHLAMLVPASLIRRSMSVASIPELLLQVFERLPLKDLISSTHVNQQWRALVPKIDAPTRLRLLGLAFTADTESPHPISLSVRRSYVEKIETTHTVLIPEPYRTILTEWPSSQPPPGMHWPHSVRFHASGFCFCFRHLHEDPEVCLCSNTEIGNVAILVPSGTFNIVMDEVVTDSSALAQGDYSWELFNNPVRLYTEGQNVQTLRFLRAHPVDQWTPGHWRRLDLKVLRLSRYHLQEKIGMSDGIFVMILEGPTRGQIHGWSSSGPDWYDGFEAENFWEWSYSEWDRDAVDSGSDLEDSDITDSEEGGRESSLSQHD